MSIETNNRVRELEKWREKAEAARERFERDLEEFRAKIDALMGRNRQEVERGKPR